LKKRIREKAETLSDRLVEIRRDLHENPEIGLEEIRTSAIAAEELSRLGLEVKTGIGSTGVAGLLTGGSPGRTIAIRADMDALPIKEDTGLAYASKNDGVMHACGHDGHVAMALGAASILAEIRADIKGNVKFIMQPAEESYGGAKEMVEEGVLEDPRVEAIIALHIDTREPPGKLTIKAGPIGASAAVFMISINGKGGHGSEPHECIDPIHVATHAIAAIQTMIPRTLDARDPVVVSVCSIQSGTAFNVIPESVHFGGTVRTLSDKRREEMPEKLEEVVRGITSTFGAGYDFAYIQGAPVPANEPEMTRLMERVAAELWGAESVVDMGMPHMGAEDYSYYMQKVPGVMGMLGARKENGTVYPPHHPKFDFDERCLPRGAELLAATAIEFLNGK
jgi:amidohydrolase